ncbi:unnamed protein product [Closterium sp. NIES-65]|nr:unnamed protein product [Closterium sp. NIES-65]
MRPPSNSFVGAECPIHEHLIHCLSFAPLLSRFLSLDPLAPGCFPVPHSFCGPSHLSRPLNHSPAWQMVVNPLKDTELIIFGGEFYNGDKTYVYGDLYRFNADKATWRLVSSPNSPPPRSGHHAVAWKNFLFVFGGEFTSPNQERFHHFKDLWRLDLNSNEWEQLNLKGAPSPRSGHRMVLYKQKILLFGGFYDNLRDVRYFNDLHVLDLNDMKWSQVKPKPGAAWPSPRSAFQFAAHQDEVYVYGGYFKDHARDADGKDKGVVLSDLWLLDPRSYEWNKVKRLGSPPSARAGFSLAVHRSRAILFGGVVDREEKGGDVLRSTFLDDMFAFQMDSRRWFPLLLRSQQQALAAARKAEVSQQRPLVFAPLHLICPCRHLFPLFTPRSLLHSSFPFSTRHCPSLPLFAPPTPVAQPNAGSAATSGTQADGEEGEGESDEETEGRKSRQAGNAGESEEEEEEVTGRRKQRLKRKERKGAKSKAAAAAAAAAGAQVEYDGGEEEWDGWEEEEEAEEAAGGGSGGGTDAVAASEGGAAPGLEEATGSRDCEMGERGEMDASRQGPREADGRGSDNEQAAAGSPREASGGEVQGGLQRLSLEEGSVGEDMQRSAEGSEGKGGDDAEGDKTGVGSEAAGEGKERKEGERKEGEREGGGTGERGEAPCSRMNAGLAVGGNTLYLWGGAKEVGDREVTLDDLFSLNLSKLDHWTCLHKASARSTPSCEGSILIVSLELLLPAAILVPLSLQYSCHSHCNTRATLTAILVPLSLQYSCHSHCNTRATLTAILVPLSLQYSCHSHCNTRATLTAILVPLSLQYSCHSHCNTRATLTAILVPLSLQYSCHSHCNTRATLTAILVPLSLQYSCHSHCNLRCDKAVRGSESTWVEVAEEEEDDEEESGDEESGEEEEDEDESSDDETSTKATGGAATASELAAALLRGEAPAGGKRQLSRKERRAEIDRIRADLGLADAARTPIPGESLRDFFARTGEHWQREAYQHTQRTGKELRKDGFELCEARYRDLLPVLTELEKLEAEQKAEEEAEAASNKSKGKKEKGRPAARR